jgi:hypothetical protein
MLIAQQKHRSSTATTEPVSAVSRLYTKLMLLKKKILTVALVQTNSCQTMRSFVKSLTIL